VSVILYAEFTAKPGSESQIQMLISNDSAELSYQVRSDLSG
jgi:hypothetical protein